MNILNLKFFEDKTSLSDVNSEIQNQFKKKKICIALIGEEIFAAQTHILLKKKIKKLNYNYHSGMSMEKK